jgi:serine protease AprX
VTDTRGVDPGLFALGDRVVSVIVQAAAGQVDVATMAARAQGADIGVGLPLVGGFVATMAASAAVRLGADPSVRAVTINRTVRFESLSYDATTTASNFARTSGATQAWAQANYGDGIGIGVIDTGVASMNDVTGRVIYGPDLSGEGTTIDSYGHGSVMAGIIGGSGADSATNSSTGYTGVAPKSWIVAVKVAGRSGAADVSTLLQAMHWMAAYKDQFNIRVVNLSWGTPSTQDPHYDPLNYAVERLWGLGIVVVVAAGNSGPNAGTILKPGDDPLVITTGAYDDKQNADPADDSLSSWTSRGPTAAGLQKPDVVAPGRTLVAMRAFGSYVEQTYPKALVGASYIKGSGSSEATAVVSGLAALIIKAHPGYTPDQVKAALTSTASPMASVAASGQGAGRVQLGAALNATPSSASWQIAAANGLGSIENSRGGAHVVTDCNEDGTLDTIQGEIDVRCDPWDGASWTGASWTGASWTGASWTGASWTGASWTGASWTGASWTGASWTGGTWTGASWQGTTSWTGASWTGASWTGASWTGASWTGASWTGASWTGASWTGADYGDDLFLNAWWGNSPPAWLAIPGEPVDPSTRRAAR